MITHYIFAPLWLVVSGHGWSNDPQSREGLSHRLWVARTSSLSWKDIIQKFVKLGHKWKGGNPV